MSSGSTTRSRSKAAALTEAAYSRWAPIYDLLFDLPFHPGRLAATRAAGGAAGRDGAILVVGVGTGLELPLLPRTARVTGIDISEAMLNIARSRVSREALGHVRALQAMDAGKLAFADGAFDVTLAPYVISVVPEPKRALDEMWRVTRSGGEMIVMNHFAAERRGPRAAIEKAMEGASGWLGWHPRFSFAVIEDWQKAHPEAQLVEKQALAPFRLFTLLRFRRP